MAHWFIFYMTYGAVDSSLKYLFPDLFTMVVEIMIQLPLN